MNFAEPPSAEEEFDLVTLKCLMNRQKFEKYFGQHIPPTSSSAKSNLSTLSLSSLSSSTSTFSHDDQMYILKTVYSFLGRDFPGPSSSSSRPSPRPSSSSSLFLDLPAGIRQLFQEYVEQLLFYKHEYDDGENDDGENDDGDDCQNDGGENDDGDGDENDGLVQATVGAAAFSSPSFWGESIVKKSS
jgi:hypothetical protein